MLCGNESLSFVHKSTMITTKEEAATQSGWKTIKQPGLSALAHHQKLQNRVKIKGLGVGGAGWGSSRQVDKAFI